MSATVVELLASGRTDMPGAVCTHRAWLQPAHPIIVGRHVTATVYQCELGRSRLIRLRVRGRRYLPMIGWLPTIGRQCVTLRRNVWSDVAGYDLAVRPVARRDSEGRLEAVLVEFAALSDRAAEDWPA